MKRLFLLLVFVYSADGFGQTKDSFFKCLETILDTTRFDVNYYRHNGDVERNIFFVKENDLIKNIIEHTNEDDVFHKLNNGSIVSFNTKEMLFVWNIKNYLILDSIFFDKNEAIFNFYLVIFNGFEEEKEEYNAVLVPSKNGWVINPIKDF